MSTQNIQKNIYQQKNSRFLFIDPEPALEVVNNPSDDDLVLQRLSEEKYLIFRDGVHIVKCLESLTNKYGFRLAFHWDQSEDEQLKLFQNLDQACKSKGLKGFPSLTAMAIKDPSQFKGYHSSDPLIVKSRAHKIGIAGYELEDEGKSCIREALSLLLKIPETERRNNFIFDSHRSAAEKAQQEGWNAYWSDEFTLKEALNDFLQKIAKPESIHISKADSFQKSSIKKHEDLSPGKKKTDLGNYLELSDMIFASKALNKGTQTI